MAGGGEVTFAKTQSQTKEQQKTEEQHEEKGTTSNAATIEELKAAPPDPADNKHPITNPPNAPDPVSDPSWQYDIADSSGEGLTPEEAAIALHMGWELAPLLKAARGKPLDPNKCYDPLGPSAALAKGVPPQFAEAMRQQGHTEIPYAELQAPRGQEMYAEPAKESSDADQDQEAVATIKGAESVGAQLADSVFGQLHIPEGTTSGWDAQISANATAKVDAGLNAKYASANAGVELSVSVSGRVEQRVDQLFTFAGSFTFGAKGAVSAELLNLIQLKFSLAKNYTNTGVRTFSTGKHFRGWIADSIPYLDGVMNGKDPGRERNAPLYVGSNSSTTKDAEYSFNMTEQATKLVEAGVGATDWTTSNNAAIAQDGALKTMAALLKAYENNSDLKDDGGADSTISNNSSGKAGANVDINDNHLLAYHTQNELTNMSREREMTKTERAEAVKRIKEEGKKKGLSEEEIDKQLKGLKDRTMRVDGKREASTTAWKVGPIQFSTCDYTVTGDETATNDGTYREERLEIDLVKGMAIVDGMLDGGLMPIVELAATPGVSATKAMQSIYTRVASELAKKITNVKSWDRIQKVAEKMQGGRHRKFADWLKKTFNISPAEISGHAKYFALEEFYMGDDYKLDDEGTFVKSGQKLRTVRTAQGLELGVSVSAKIGVAGFEYVSGEVGASAQTNIVLSQQVVGSQGPDFIYYMYDAIMSKAPPPGAIEEASEGQAELKRKVHEQKGEWDKWLSDNMGAARAVLRNVQTFTGAAEDGDKKYTIDYLAANVAAAQQVNESNGEKVRNWLTSLLVKRYESAGSRREGNWRLSESQDTINQWTKEVLVDRKKKLSSFGAAEIADIGQVAYDLGIEMYGITPHNLWSSFVRDLQYLPDSALRAAADSLIARVAGMTMLSLAEDAPDPDQFNRKYHGVLADMKGQSQLDEVTQTLQASVIYQADDLTTVDKHLEGKNAFTTGTIRNYWTALNPEKPQLWSHEFEKILNEDGFNQRLINTERMLDEYKRCLPKGEDDDAARPAHRAGGFIHVAIDEMDTRIQDLTNWGILDQRGQFADGAAQGWEYVRSNEAFQDKALDQFLQQRFGDGNPTTKDWDELKYRRLFSLTSLDIRNLETFFDEIVVKYPTPNGDEIGNLHNQWNYCAEKLQKVHVLNLQRLLDATALFDRNGLTRWRVETQQRLAYVDTLHQEAAKNDQIIFGPQK